MSGVLAGRERLAPYVPRKVRALGTQTISDHSIKLYVLEAAGRSASPELLEAARHTVEEALAARNERFFEHRIGFTILHCGEDALWLLVDRWIDGAILCHRLCSTIKDEPSAVFEDRSGGDLCFCVWEGAIVDHERRAFAKHMMRDTPDVSAYLSDTLNGPV